MFLLLLHRKKVVCIFIVKWTKEWKPETLKLANIHFAQSTMEEEDFMIRIMVRMEIHLLCV
jgi:hypothetical protein